MAPIYVKFIIARIAIGMRAPVCRQTDLRHNAGSSTFSSVTLSKFLDLSKPQFSIY